MPRAAGYQQGDLNPASLFFNPADPFFGGLKFTFPITLFRKRLMQKRFRRNGERRSLRWATIKSSITGNGSMPRASETFNETPEKESVSPASPIIEPSNRPFIKVLMNGA